MPTLDTRAYIGRDNWTHTRWRYKGKDANGNDVEEWVKFESVITDVWLVPTFAVNGVTTELPAFKESEHPASFKGDDLGNLYVRQGEMTALEAGKDYQVRLIGFDANNPDGLVFADRQEDKLTDTYLIKAR